VKLRKARARLAKRREAYDKAMSRPGNLAPKGYKRPGSLKK
jgi:hypothetical protein